MLRGYRAAGAGLLIFVLPVLAAAPATRPSDDTVILLHSTAVVTGDEVLLSDIADINGEASELAGDWPVAAAPHPGASGVIDAAHVQRVLSRKGVNLSSWIFRGASRCAISRPAGSISARPKSAPTTRPDRARRGLGSPTTRPEDLAGGADVPSPTTLEGAVYAHIGQRLGDLSGKLIVKFSPSATRLLNLSTTHYEFRIADRGEKTLGMVPLEVSVLEKGEVQQVVQMLCEATFRKQVVVAGRAVNRGEILAAEDLRTEIRTFEKIEDIGLADPAMLVGQRVRRLIKPGEQFALRDIEPVPLVERNDLVTVSLRRGGLSITAAARAMSAGCHGDTISLRSELSKETFTGVVIGIKKVELANAADNSAVHAKGPTATPLAEAGGRK